MFHLLVLLMQRAFAVGFGGPLPDVLPTTETDLVKVVITIFSFVLNLIGLMAAVILVIAGIRLIFSQGDEEGKDKAKKTILYAVIGLLVILFARAIIGLSTTLTWLGL